MNVSARAHRARLHAHGFNHVDLTVYGLERRTPEEAASYISRRHQQTVLRPTLNRPDKSMLEDKWEVGKLFAGHDLPIPQTLGNFHPTIGLTMDGEPFRIAEAVEAELQRSDVQRLIVKPRGGRQSRNVLAADVVRSSEPLQLRVDGEVSTVAEFLESLPTDAFNDYDAGYEGWLFQERVTQHPVLDEVAPWTVNTIRPITLLRADGTARVHAAVVRFGRVGNVADNWALGGISVAIDVDTGRLGRGVLKPKYGGQWTDRHPDSQVEFEGRQLPMWDRIVEVCVRAAEAMPPTVRSIGWDIALGEDGPVILEGNADWDIWLVQVHGPLLTDKFRAELSGLGVQVPDSLPAVTKVLAHAGGRKVGKMRSR